MHILFRQYVIEKWIGFSGRNFLCFSTFFHVHQFKFDVKTLQNLYSENVHSVEHSMTLIFTNFCKLCWSTTSVYPKESQCWFKTFRNRCRIPHFTSFCDQFFDKIVMQKPLKIFDQNICNFCTILVEFFTEHCFVVLKKKNLMGFRNHIEFHVLNFSHSPNCSSVILCILEYVCEGFIKSTSDSLITPPLKEIITPYGTVRQLQKYTQYFTHHSKAAKDSQKYGACVTIFEPEQLEVRLCFCSLQYLLILRSHLFIYKFIK